MTLSREYYNAYGERLLEAAEALSPGLSFRISAGLAGEGSQCLGFDDQLSQDHDFAPGFCIWMSDADYAAYGPSLQAVYDSLPDEFCGITRQNIIAQDRLGVMSSSAFFNAVSGIPETDQDWLFIAESALASTVNGEVWLSGCVEFEEIRSRLIHFYPDDVLRKKIAARAAVISQSGQYNLIRILRRNDPVAAMLTASRFTEAVISMIHLLERKYTPFYKWQMRSLEELSKTSPLARLTAYELRKLSKVCILPGEQAAEEAFSITETICRAIAGELRLQGFSYAESSFLQDHLEEIMSKIKNPEIRAMHPMADPAF